MKSIKCLIADDEPLALDILESYIKKFEFLMLCSRCKDGVEVLNFLQKNTVDLIFLDIQMPLISGIDLLKNLKKLPKVIFTTAYREFALEGYELNVSDYLVKPISFERFVSSINKVITQNESTFSPSLNLLANIQEPFIYIKSERKMVKIFLKNILYIEGLKDYVKITTSERMFITYQTLNYLDEKLPDQQFLRIHKGYIVNINHISSFTPTDIEIRDKHFPIGRFYKSQTLKSLQHFNL